METLFEVVVGAMNVYALVPLVSVLAYAGLFALALRRHPRRRERRAFCLYLAAAGLWSFVSFLLHLDNEFLHRFTLPGSTLLILTMVWTVVTYYHFVRVFVQRPAGLGVYPGAGFVLLLAVLGAMGFVPRDAYAEGGILYIDNGPALFLFAPFMIGMVVAAGVFLGQHYKGATTPLARTRIAYLLIGLAVVSLAGLTNLNDSLRKYPADHLGNLANALIISYAILHYQLLDIRVVVRRGLAYTLLTTVLTAAYLLLLFGLQSAFRSWSGYSSLLIAAVLALGMAVAFVPLGHLAQERVDRMFFQDTYRYRKALLEFSSRITNILDLHELAHDILTPVVTVMHARQAALLLPDPESGDLRAQFVYGDTNGADAPRDMRLRQGNPLLTWLQKEAKPLRREHIDTLPQGKGLWQEEQEALANSQTALLCPIVYRGNLTGILALGDKTNGPAYTDEEVDLLLTMASGAAMALENARMLDNVRRSQHQTEQLLAQVVAATEEERKRIAADLHDGVAQTLVRALYQTQLCQVLLARQNGAAASEELPKVESVVDGSLKELRRVLAGLRPPSLEELGLTPAVEQALNSLETDGISCHFEIKGTPVRLSPTVEIAVYRIVQEALNNVRKHAQARRVILRVAFQPEALHIEVADDGQGFDVSRTLEGAISANHLGLLGMKQRVEWLGGTLRVESGQMMGSRLTVNIPL